MRLAFTNQKGGVGKTTTVFNTGAALARLGYSVLLVDIDPQSNLTVSAGLEPEELELDIYNVLKGDTDINSAIMETNSGCKLLPATLALSAAELELAGLPAREYLLKKQFKALAAEPDYILIDCPPSLGIYTLNALTAADRVIIPIQTEYLALYGAGQLLQVVEVVQEALNESLTIAGVVATMHDNRRIIDREVVESLRVKFDTLLFNTIIRANVALVEASSAGQDVYTYNAKSNGAQDYSALAAEIIERTAGQ